MIVPLRGTDQYREMNLQGSVESKRQVDKVIDKCSAMQVKCHESTLRGLEQFTDELDS